MRTRRAGAATALCLILGMQSACGGAKPAIDADGARLLQAEVRSARAAAATGNFAGSSAGLSDARQTVVALRAGDKITEARARNVLTAIRTVEAALAPLATTTSVSTTISTRPPTPSTKPPGHGHGKGDRKQGGDGGD